MADEHGVHHYNYYKIYGVLLVLLVISIVGPVFEIPIVTLITAFGVAGVKAWIVIKYFMHLDGQRPVVHYFLITSVAFMILFFAGIAPDVMKHDGLRWENTAAKAEIARAQAAIEEGGHHGEGGDHSAGDDATHGSDGEHGDGGH